MSHRLTGLAGVSLLAIAGCGDAHVEPEPASGRVVQAVEPPDPATKPYFHYFEARADADERFNYTMQKPRTIQIAGSTLVFDDADTNHLLTNFNGQFDVKRLDIYAEKVIVRTQIKLPGTELHIHAEELRFEDTGAAPSSIDTSPRSLAQRAGSANTTGEPGENGLKGGDAYVYVKTFTSDQNRTGRLILRGGNGQQGGLGRNGDNGHSRTLLAVSFPFAVSWAEESGVIGMFPLADGHYSLGNVQGLGISQLKNQTIELGAEFPEDGQDATPGGKPGSGGDGGRLHTLQQDLGAYADRSGGVAGANAGLYSGGAFGEPMYAVKLNIGAYMMYPQLDGHDGINQADEYLPTWYALYVTDVQFRLQRAGADKQSPGADKAIGTPGTSNVDPGTLAWYHPHALEMILAFAEDAYANGFLALAQGELEKQEATLAALQAGPDWATLAPEDQRLFEQEGLRVGGLLKQLRAHQDYWGNPQAWVPALSLEANVALYRQEVEWAIRSIFVADWLTDENNAAKDKTAAMTQAKVLVGQEIATLEAKFDDALGQVPQLKSDAANVAIQLADLGTALKMVEQRLADKAKSNVEARNKLPFWKKALRVVAVAARALPVPAPYSGIVKGASAILDVATGAETTWQAIESIPDVVSGFSSTDDDAKAKAAKDKKTEQKPETKAAKDDLKATIGAIYKEVKPMADALKKEKAKFTDAEVKKDDLDKAVAKELETLKAADESFKMITDKLTPLNASRDQLAKNIDTVTKTLGDTAAAINEHYLQYAELLPKIQGQAAVIASQRSELALGDLRRKALRRLKKYQYLLARAYEYRMLKPYPGDLTMTNMFNEMVTLIRSTGATGVLQAAEYDQLYTLYREDLSTIVEEVADAYSAGAGQFTATVHYDLSADDLARLNTGDKLSINFWERGAFQSTDQDVRIVSFQIVSLDVTQTGDGGFPYVDLETEHAGLSRIWREGHVKVFQHYNSNTSQPLRWATRWEAGQVTQHELAASSESLLRALLPGTVDIMLFSRPSAWADLSLHKRVHGDPGVDFTVNHARIELKYDYTPSTSSPWSAYRDGQNTAIQTTYQAVVRRAASADELRDARQLLDVGNTQTDLVPILQTVHHEELRRLQAGDIFDQAFHRVPTDDERAFWANELANGRPAAQVIDYTQRIVAIVGDIPSYDQLAQYVPLFDQGWVENCTPGCNGNDLVTCSNGIQTVTTCGGSCLATPEPHCAVFVPRNGVDPAFLDGATFDASVPNGATWVINTDDGSITQCPAQAIRPANAPATNPIQFDVVPAVAGGRAIAVFSLDNLTVQPGGRVIGLGSRALAIQARGDVVVNGAIIVAGGPAACSVQAACANGVGTSPTCAGPGGGAGHPVTIGIDGPGSGALTAGGGFAGAGGSGGGASYAVPANGLIGGSGGGEGSFMNVGGGGGGALQISTQTRIDLGGTQGILASGGAGTAPGSDMFDVMWSGAGGGAGGLVVLDAPTVHVNAFLLANGGGGGGGGGSASDAPASSFQSMRQAGGSGGSPGGAGGGFGILNGESAYFIPMGGSGGGGGGAGYLRIFTATNGYVQGGSAVVSPTPTLGAAVIQ
jgi:hypothetical protein